MGGEYTIRIKTIVTLTNKKNYEQNFRSLYYFDAIITGMDIGDKRAKKIRSPDAAILSQFIKSKLNDNKIESMPKYMMETFQNYASQKTQLTINLIYMERYFEKIGSLIMQNISTEPSDPSKVNLLKPILFLLFQNVTSIVLITAGVKDQNYCQYIVNIPHLLKTIRTAFSWKREIKIMLRAAHKTKENVATWDERIPHNEWVGETWIQTEWGKMTRQQKEIVIAEGEEKKECIVMSERCKLQMSHFIDGEDFTENEGNGFVRSLKETGWIEVWNYLEDEGKYDEDNTRNDKNYNYEVKPIKKEYISDKYVLSFEQISITSREKGKYRHFNISARIYNLIVSTSLCQLKFCVCCFICT